MTEAQAETTQQRNVITRFKSYWDEVSSLQKFFLAMVIIRWGINLLFLQGVLPLSLGWKWFLQHGGDQDLMFRLAMSIVKGEPKHSLVGLGQALVMIPWILIFDAQVFGDIVVPLVLINGFLLGGLSVLLVGSIAHMAYSDKRVTLSVTAIWSILPLIAYVSFFWHPEGMMVASSTVPTVGWLNGLSDAPASFLILLMIYFLGKNVEHDKDIPFWQSVAVGVSMGLAFTFRVHTALVVGFLLVYILIYHGWRALGIVCVAGLVAYIPQAWYNQAVYGLPITVGYISYWDVEVPTWEGGTLGRPLANILDSLPFNPRHLLDNLGYHLGRRPWLVVPIVAVMTMIAITLREIWKRKGLRMMLLIIGAPMAYLLPMSMTFPFKDDPIRFTLPALPFLIMVMVFVSMKLFDQARNWYADKLMPASEER